MNKKLLPLFIPVCMIACSQESNVEPVAGGVSEIPEEEFGTVLPHFIFGEDGSRYSRDAESGELVKKEMNRSELVVANEDSFDSLKHAYRIRENKNLEYPVNYFCRNDLLAINTDYSKVVTKDGKVLLDDASLFDGCVDVSKGKALKKSYQVSDFSEYDTFQKYHFGALGLSFVECFPEPSSETGVTCEGAATMAVFVYDPVEEKYVPFKPTYARLIHVVFNNESCQGEGSNFKCDNKKSFSVPMISKDEVTTGYGESTWTHREMVSDVAKHFIIYGRDTITIKTAVNASKSLAKKVYNKYLASWN